MQFEANFRKSSDQSLQNAALKLVRTNGVRGAIRYCYAEQFLGLLPYIHEIAAGRATPKPA
ncbi:hypothetical protein [Aestuariispira insulae]|uniref:Uncharacterized protein n=1 Tax=Aestuariispira insulae TaxID=1461337 RepID=A0A3D9H2T2_9PROT|nr:hypothetical protein [Aestuariispira insulae]RED43782.1 hypothetical protein DFP90_1185 [Aestuariispira insulae]